MTLNGGPQNGGPQGQYYYHTDSSHVPLHGTSLTTTAGRYTLNPTSTPPDDNPFLTEIACLASGHTMGEEVELADGSYIVFCDRCGARLVLRHIPGGVSLLRCRVLLMSLAAGEEITEDTLGTFLELRKLLEGDLEALELATAILDQAAEIVKAKGGLDSSSS